MSRPYPLSLPVVALLLAPLSLGLMGCPLLCLLGADLCEPATGPVGYGLVQQPTCQIRTPPPNGRLEPLCGRGEVCQFIQQNGKFVYDGDGNGRGSEVARGWTAENAVVVSASPGIEVCTRDRMLQFLATSPDGPSADTFSEVVQLIPLDNYVIDGRTVRARMLVNRLDQNVDTEFVLSLRAMAGDPADYSREERDNHLALNFFRYSSDFAQASWEAVQATLAIPSGTEYLAVEIAASENVTNETSSAEFAGHFADHVEVALVQPAGSYDAAIELARPPDSPFRPGEPVDLEYVVRNLGPEGMTGPMEVALSFGDQINASDRVWSIPPFTPTDADERRTIRAGSLCDASPDDPVDAYDVTAEIVSGLGMGDNPSNNRVDLNLRPSNFSPVAVDDVYQAAPGVPLSIPAPGLLANDSDPEGDALSVNPVDAPVVTTHFDLRLDGGLDVTLEPDFSERFVRFSYSASDGTSRSCGADVFLVVGSGPVVVDGLSNQALAPDAGPVRFDLTNRFLDPDDAVLTYSVTTSDAAVLDATVDGATLTITPLQDGSPVDVVVSAEDPDGNTASFTFAVVVGDENEEPIVVNPISDQTLDVANPPLTIDLTQVFDDPEGDPLTYGVTVLDGDGILDASVDGGTLTITPIAPGGPVPVLARAQDGFRRSTASSFLVTVTESSPQPPVIVSPLPDTTLLYTAPVYEMELFDVFDGEIDDFSFVAEPGSEDAFEATLFVSTLRIDPEAPGGPFGVIARAENSAGVTADSFLVTITAPGNNPPVAVDDIASTLEDTPVTIHVLANDFDPDGDGLDIMQIPAQPANGSASFNFQDGVNQIEYQPNAGFTGTDTFTYRYRDVQNNWSNDATVEVTVEAGPEG